MYSPPTPSLLRNEGASFSQIIESAAAPSLRQQRGGQGGEYMEHIEDFRPNLSLYISPEAAPSLRQQRGGQGGESIHQQG